MFFEVKSLIRCYGCQGGVFRCFFSSLLIFVADVLSSYQKILSKIVLCSIWQINGVSVTSARINIMLGEVNGHVHKVKLLS